MYTAMENVHTVCYVTINRWEEGMRMQHRGLAVGPTSTRSNQETEHVMYHVAFHRWEEGRRMQHRGLAVGSTSSRSNQEADRSR